MRPRRTFWLCTRVHGERTMLYTVSLTIHKEKTAEVPGSVVNEYEIEHIPAAHLEGPEGRAILEEALAALRRLPTA